MTHNEMRKLELAETARLKAITQEAKRTRALALFRDGVSQNQIAQQLRVGRETVSAWVRYVGTEVVR